MSAPPATEDLPRPMGRLLKIAEVERATSLHRATIYRHVERGTFPAPIPLGKRRVAWPESAVERWKREQAATPRN